MCRQMPCKNITSCGSSWCVAQKRLYLNKLPRGSLSPSTSNLNSIRLAGLLPVTSIEMEGLCHRPLLLNFSYGNKCPGQYRQGISEPGFTRGKILGNLIRYHDQGAEIAPSLCGAEREWILSLGSRPITTREFEQSTLPVYFNNSKYF